MACEPCKVPMAGCKEEPGGRAVDPMLARAGPSRLATSTAEGSPDVPALALPSSLLGRWASGIFASFKVESAVDSLEPTCHRQICCHCWRLLHQLVHLQALPARLQQACSARRRA